MLIGEYQHNIDDKKRLIIPSKLRSEFDGKIVITRGLDGCLFGYSLSMWEKIMMKFNTLSFTKSDVRKFTRFFTSGATTLEFDKQGRVVLPSYLIDFAAIKKDVCIVGVINRLEIWSQDKWDEFIQSNVDSLSDISENLFDSNLDL